MLPASIAVIREAVPGHRLALALGLWVAGATAGAAVGPLIGGVLLAASSWRAIFWPNVAIGILSIGVVLMALRGTATTSRRSSLHAGWNSVIALGLTGVVWGLIDAGSSGWTSGRVLLALVVGLALLVAVSLRVRAAVGRRGWLGMDVRFLLGTLSMTVLFLFGLVGTFFLLAIYLQRVLGFSPLETGILVLPLTAVAALFAPLVGWAVSRVGRRAMLLTGFGLEVAALAGLSRLGTSSSYHDVWPFFLLLGLAAATIPTVTLDLVMARAREAKAGIVSGFQTAAFHLGNVISIALLGSVAASTVVGAYTTRLHDAGLDAGGQLIGPKSVSLPRGSSLSRPQPRARKSGSSNRQGWRRSPRPWERRLSSGRSAWFSLPSLR